MFLNLSGIKGLASMAAIILLVSGCSSKSKPDYDPLEVIEYEKCLDAKIADAEWERIPNTYFEQIWDSIEEFCEAYKPIKQE